MVLKIEEYHSGIPSFSWGIVSHDVFEAIVHEQKYLLDSKEPFYLLINSPGTILISLLT